jgi:predicted ester cyclase
MAVAPITRVRHQDINDILQPRHERRQELTGFDDVYSDIVHYIAYCTHRIWAERAVGLIYSHYDPAVTVNTPYGVSAGVEHVMASTLAMMQAFPDRESRLVDVAWTGNAEQGFYTSHFGQSTMTNRGPTVYGPATGRRVHIRHCADCQIKANQIHNEWLVRDNGALVRQLGLEPAEVAARLAAAEAGSGVRPVVPGLPERSQGQRLPVPLDAAIQGRTDRVRHMLHDVWNRRLFDRIARDYDPDCAVHTAPGMELDGVEGLQWYVIRMLAAFPDAELRLDHMCEVQETDGPIVAVRWTLVGTHRGVGLFGAPTGRVASILGMSHFRFAGTGDDARIVEEWTVWDEIAVLKQLAAAADAVTVA